MAIAQDYDLLGCSDCGSSVSPETDRVYAFGTDGVLCMECSLRRGGAWNEAGEQWTVPPRVDDLLLRSGAGLTY